MKHQLLYLILFLTSFVYAQADYKIEINGEVHEIELDKEYELKINNKLVKVNVKQNDTLTYVDEAFTFKFPKEYKVGRTVIDEGIEQLMLMTPDGSGFILQKYSTINPTMLNELMMNEVTKESVNYGFELVRKDYKRKLASGTKIDVDKAVLRYKDELNIYEIASIGQKDSGLIIMTMQLGDEDSFLGKELINLIWATLEIK